MSSIRRTKSRILEVGGMTSRCACARSMASTRTGRWTCTFSDFRACAKLFEMYVADHLTRKFDCRDRPFLLWEDIDHETKEARGLTGADTGVDVTDGATTIVQCKLRSRAVTWGECATFFGSAVAYDATAAAYSVPWKSLLLARNASSGLSPHLRALARSRPFDTPIEMSEVSAYCTRLLSLDSELVETAAHPLLPAQLPTLRDYQREAVELCCSETESAGYIVLPTGTGKNVVIAESVRRVLARDGDARVLVLVPMIVLLEQLLEILETARSGGPSGPSVEAVAVGGGRTPSAAEIREARLVVCVYNSAASVGAAQFTRVFIDEAHFARPPEMYADLRDDSSSSSSAESPEQSGYDAVREAGALPSARLLSATLDVPVARGGASAPNVTRGVREMIDAGYLCDYTLHVPVFGAGGIGCCYRCGSCEAPCANVPVDGCVLRDS